MRPLLLDPPDVRLKKIETRNVWLLSQTGTPPSQSSSSSMSSSSSSNPVSSSSSSSSASSSSQPAYRKIGASVLLKKVLGLDQSKQKSDFFKKHPSTASKAPRKEFIQPTVPPKPPVALPFPPALKPNPAPVLTKVKKAPETKKPSDAKAFVPPKTPVPQAKKSFSSIPDEDFVVSDNPTVTTVDEAGKETVTIFEDDEQPASPSSEPKPPPPPPPKPKGTNAISLNDYVLSLEKAPVRSFVKRKTTLESPPEKQPVKKGKKEAKKPTSTRGRKKKAPQVQVYLPPTKEQINLYKQHRKKPAKGRRTTNESAEIKMRRDALEALDVHRSAPFEMDPMLLEAPPQLIASRIEYPHHTQRLYKRFRITLDHTPRKTMYVAVANVSF